MEFERMPEGGDGAAEIAGPNREESTPQTAFETANPDVTGMVVTGDSALSHTVSPAAFGEVESPDGPTIPPDTPAEIAAEGAAQATDERRPPVLPLAMDDTLLIRALEVDDDPMTLQSTQAELAPAGLEVQVSPTPRKLTVVDPAAFTAALGEVDPESGTAYTIRPHAPQLLERALYRASGTGPAADEAFAIALANSAAALADTFGRLGVPEDGTLGIRELALAHNQGSIGEWQALHRQYAIGQNEARLDKRLRTQDDWDTIAPHLARLQAVAPEGEFTQHVRQRLVSEIEVSEIMLKATMTHQERNYLNSSFAAPEPSMDVAEYVSRMRSLQYGLQVVERALPEPGQP